MKQGILNTKHGARNDEVGVAHSSTLLICSIFHRFTTRHEAVTARHEAVTARHEAVTARHEAETNKQIIEI
jgi:hypothetical protein